MYLPILRSRYSNLPTAHRAQPTAQRDQPSALDLRTAATCKQAATTGGWLLTSDSRQRTRGPWRPQLAAGYVMEQDLARGCPDKPSSPRARGPRRHLQRPQRPFGGDRSASYSARLQRPQRRSQRPFAGHPAHCSSCSDCTCAGPFFLFSFPLHIPTDIVVKWRVRRAGPAQVAGFRHAILYGKF